MRALIGNAEAEAEGGGKKSNAEEKRQMAMGDGRFVSAVHATAATAQKAEQLLSVMANGFQPMETGSAEP